MAPHLEHFTGKYRHDLGDMQIGGIWEEVPLTKHFSGDNTTNNAKLTHKNAKKDPENYREVADDAGEVCPGYDQFELLDQLKP
jgi:hypothetical protein